MCILLKLHYAKFDVSTLLCSKVETPPPPDKGRVNGLYFKSYKESERPT